MEHLVEQFQCPGCVCGSDSRCGEYYFDPELQRCTSHVLGTSLGLGDSFALGLPKGFNKPRLNDAETRRRNTINVRLWEAGTQPDWDHLNIPVWFMTRENFLFVRTFAPRIDYSWIDVIENGQCSILPLSTVDAGLFIEEID